MFNFVCGDMHGKEFDSRKVSTKKWKGKKGLTKEDVLFQLGDFGWVWYEFGVNKEQEKWLDTLAEQRYTLAVIPGNHENYDVIEKLPTIQKWGAPVRVLKREKGEIYFLERGYVYTVNGKKIFVFGGARSNKRPDNYIPPTRTYMSGFKVDRTPIVEGVNWWSRELPNDEEMERGRKTLEEHNWEVDWVFTHTCPTSIVKTINEAGKEGKLYKWDKKSESREDDPVSIYLEEIDKKLKFKYLCFGHFHLDWSIDLDDKTYMCFYRDTPLNMSEFSEY